MVAIPVSVKTNVAIHVDGVWNAFKDGSSTLPWSTNFKMKTIYTVWNNWAGETRFFFTLDENKKYAKDEGDGSERYTAWDDYIYKVTPGQNILDGEEVDLHDFKMSIEK